MEQDKKAQLITDIIAHEWDQFDKVNNVGGRAECQDNWKTFNIMRRAQFLNWPEELLASYMDDLLAAEKEERNLIAEKYGRMMESTSPEEYKNICHLFPVLSEERKAEQEESIQTQLAMDDVFTAKYPVYASGGRASRTSEDNIYSTSKETYLRGEMSTWSDRTFGLYHEWVKELSAQGLNLPEMTAENIVKQYGFGSLDDAEAVLKARRG